MLNVGREEGGKSWDCGRPFDREVVDVDGEGGEVMLGGRAVALASIEFGRDLVVDVRFSAIADRAEGSFGRMLVVRDSPFEGDCGSLVEGARARTVLVLVVDGAGAVPINAARASALASVGAGRACVRTEGALPSPPL